MPEVAPLDPERLLTTLAVYGVHYVLIGAMAARLQGFPRVTADADITPAMDDENLERLATALRSLGARIYTDTMPEGLPFDCSARTLARAEVWNLVTNAGRLDVIFSPPGTLGYDDLVEHAVAYRVFGIEVSAASLEDIIRTKTASERPQDRQDVLILREMMRRNVEQG